MPFSIYRLRLWVRERQRDYPFLGVVRFTIHMTLNLAFLALAGALTYFILTTVAPQ